jgi:hypothetical protein
MASAVFATAFVRRAWTRPSTIASTAPDVKIALRCQNNRLSVLSRTLEGAPQIALVGVDPKNIFTFGYFQGFSQ